MGEIHIFHDRDARPEEWRVEEIDSDDDGGIDLAIFSGPHAEQRAKRFADRPKDEARAAERNQECKAAASLISTLLPGVAIRLDETGAGLLHSRYADSPGTPPALSRELARTEPSGEPGLGARTWRRCWTMPEFGSWAVRAVDPRTIHFAEEAA